jgi:triacylglycerol lipase
MFFPPGFDRGEAILLGRLVVKAYDQLAAFQEETDWSVGDDLALLAELRCPAGTAAQSTDPFVQSIVRRRRSGRSPEVGIPIGFIAGNGEAVYLVFRGTVTAAEWIRDLGIRLAPYPYGDLGRTHEGFVKTYADFRATIIDALSGIKAAKTLFITGHSLGAALATLSAPDIISATRFKAPRVYTYGSPRVGDSLFAAGYNGLCGRTSFRVTNTSDLVTSLPLPVPFLGVIGGYFTHVDTPVDFTEQEEDLEKNHDMSTYLAALEAAPRPRGLLSRLLGRST